MIYIDPVLNIRKSVSDVGYIRCDTSGLPSKNIDDYTLLITNEHNQPIKIYKCKVIEDETLFFTIDNSVEEGNYFYSVMYNCDDEVQVFLSKLKYDVKEGVYD